MFLYWAKICIEKYTLILEMVDILIKILDTEIENFYLQDIAIQELSSSMSEHTHEIVSNFINILQHIR